MSPHTLDVLANIGSFAGAFALFFAGGMWISSPKRTNTKTIHETMEEIADALPIDATKDVALFRFDEDDYRCMAGGSSAVLLGEASGDFQADGHTPEIAAARCLAAIKEARIK